MECCDCNKGLVKETVVEEYEVNLGGTTFYVKNAKILVCDQCGTKYYDWKEIRRWERLRKKYLKGINNG